MSTLTALAFVMITELSIDPSKIDEFLAITQQHLPASQNYQGNIQFNVMIDTSDANKVVFYEVWESQAAQQQYWTWRVQQGDFQTLMKYLIAEPVPKFYDLVY